MNRMMPTTMMDAPSQSMRPLELTDSDTSCGITTKAASRAMTAHVMASAQEAHGPPRQLAEDGTEHGAHHEPGGCSGAEEGEDQRLPQPVGVHADEQDDAVGQTVAEPIPCMARMTSK